MNATGIYLDHAATTPVDPRVVEVMLPFFNERFGNPSSIYALGRDARASLDWARGTVAQVLGCEPTEIVFTSGATESNNAAIRGAAWRAWSDRRDASPHIIVSAIEHPSVLQTVESLKPYGFEVSLVPPGPDGIVRAEDVARAIRPSTCLVSVMYANNEIGTIQPVAEIASLARERGVLVHTDAVQAAGALPLDVDALGVDMITLSAHKFYGPKGIGVLYVRDGTTLDWQQRGGGQENTRRGGTENVPSIVGMAAALALAHNEQNERVEHMRALRDRLIEGLLERVPDTRLNGDHHLRLPNNVNVSFASIDGGTLLQHLDMLGIAASSGSACSTGSTEPSHVLLAIGLDPDLARGSLRLTVGKDTTSEEVDRAVTAIAEAVMRMRALATVDIS